MDIAEEILSLKKKIETDKEKQNKAEGAIQNILDQLKKDFNVDSIEAAKKELQKMEKELSQIEKATSNAIESFKEKYGITAD